MCADKTTKILQILYFAGQLNSQTIILSHPVKEKGENMMEKSQGLS